MTTYVDHCQRESRVFICAPGNTCIQGSWTFGCEWVLLSNCLRLNLNDHFQTENLAAKSLSLSLTAARSVAASLQLQAQLNSAWVHCCHKRQQVRPGTCQTKQAPRELQWFLLTPLSLHSLSSKNVNTGTHKIAGLQRTAIGRIGEVLSARTCPCTQPYVYALDKLVDPSCAAVCKSVRFRISTRSNQPQKYLAWLLTDTQCV